MQRFRRLTMALGLISLFLASAISAQSKKSPVPEELVYEGRPMTRYISDQGMLIEDRDLTSAEAEEYRLRITKRGTKYYWKSRENVELVMQRSDVYVTFSSPAGFIKLINPFWDEARAPLRDTDPREKYDYIEVMHHRLGLYIYHGRGTGKIP